MPAQSWDGGTFTIVDRDGSTLELYLDTDHPAGCLMQPLKNHQERTGGIVKVGPGTGRFLGAQGSGTVALRGTNVRLEGDLTLTISIPLPPAPSPGVVSHHLAIEGLALLDALGGDQFAGTAVSDGYNRHVVYQGSTVAEDPFITGWWMTGKFTIVERDGSTLVVELDGPQPYRSSSNFFYDSYQKRTGDVIITSGTGHFAGTHGRGHVTLEGSNVRMEGDLVLTLSS